jgi:FMN phosphatase YigB (HAD superfamily)
VRVATPLDLAPGAVSLERLPQQGSTLPGYFLAKAVLLTGSVVAFDVFDTLVERSVRPEHVKILACDRLVQRLGLERVCGLSLYRRRQRIESALASRNRRAIGEVEFRHVDMAAELHAELLASGLIPNGVSAATFASAALRTELSVERQVLRAKSEALDVLHAARSAGKRVLLLSDFYMPSSDLAELLASVGIAPPLYESLYVSCEHMASKRSGRLYDLVLTETRCAASDLTMFGDNVHSDVAMAIDRGIRAFLVDTQARMAFYSSDAADVTHSRRLIDGLRALMEAPSAPKEHLRSAVPSLLLFIERLYRTSRQRGLRHLFFLAREGQLLQRMFEAYQDALGEDAEGRIWTHYLLVSRRACYAASLAALEEERFDGLFAHYRSISLRDFWTSLGLSMREFDRIAGRLPHDPEVVEPDFPNSPIFRALLAIPDFATLYEAHRTEQRNNLLSYLAGFDVDLVQHPLAVVDCGWKGSIQDFLRRALPAEVAVQGFYLGLIDVGQEVCEKSGLLFSNVGVYSEKYSIFAENRSLFEVLLCADHGSAKGYARDMEGRVYPIIEDDAVERHFVEETSLPVARDAEQVFRALATMRLMTGIRRAEWERIVAEIHAGLVFRPWLPHARWLMNAQHRESFGVFHLSKLSRGGAVSIAGRLSFLVKLLWRPRALIRGSFWPASMLYAHGGAPLVRCYALIRRLRAPVARRRFF